MRKELSELYAVTEGRAEDKIFMTILYGLILLQRYNVFAAISF